MEVFKKSTAAGIMIAIGATIYLSCTNKIVGAILFSTGLFSICAFGMNLFTGKIGYVLENKNNPNCLLIWLGNFFGCALAVLPIRFAKPALFDPAFQMVTAKLELGIVQVIISAIFCGILMYIAVENYRSSKSDFGKQMGLFLCVSAFILCGFEHSIADMCYCLFAVNSVEMAVRSLVFLIIVSVSNGAGALLIRWFTKNCDR